MCWWVGKGVGGCGEVKRPWVLERARMGLGDGEGRAFAQTLYFMGRPDDGRKLVWSSGSMGQHPVLPACQQGSSKAAPACLV